MENISKDSTINTTAVSGDCNMTTTTSMPHSTITKYFYFQDTDMSCYRSLREYLLNSTMPTSTPSSSSSSSTSTIKWKQTSTPQSADFVFTISSLLPQTPQLKQQAQPHPPQHTNKVPTLTTNLTTKISLLKYISPHISNILKCQVDDALQLYLPYTVDVSDGFSRDSFKRLYIDRVCKWICLNYCNFKWMFYDGDDKRECEGVYCIAVGRCKCLIADSLDKDEDENVNENGDEDEDEVNRLLNFYYKIHETSTHTSTVSSSTPKSSHRKSPKSQPRPRSPQIYILKPPQSSNGIGLELHYRLDRILERVDGMGGRLVQDYVVWPVLLDCNAVRGVNGVGVSNNSNSRAKAKAKEGYKFDIRQWVLYIQDPIPFDSDSDSDLPPPPRVYIYSTFYLRICAQTYSWRVEDLGELKRHLTNFSLNIQAKHSNYVAVAVDDDDRSRSDHGDDDDDDTEECNANANKANNSNLFWSQQGFGRYLNDYGYHDSTLINITSQINNCIKSTIENTIPSIMPLRKTTKRGSFELLGYDFIVFSPGLRGDEGGDEYEMSVKLLEINQTPSLRHRGVVSDYGGQFDVDCGIQEMLEGVGELTVGRWFDSSTNSNTLTSDDDDDEDDNDDEYELAPSWQQIEINPNLITASSKPDKPLPSNFDVIGHPIKPSDLPTLEKLVTAPASVLIVTRFIKRYALAPCRKRLACIRLMQSVVRMFISRCFVLFVRRGIVERSACGVITRCMMRSAIMYINQRLIAGGKQANASIDFLGKRKMFSHVKRENYIKIHINSLIEVKENSTKTTSFSIFKRNTKALYLINVIVKRLITLIKQRNLKRSQINSFLLIKWPQHMRRRVRVVVRIWRWFRWCRFMRNVCRLRVLRMKRARRVLRGFVRVVKGRRIERNRVAEVSRLSVLHLKESHDKAELERSTSLHHHEALLKQQEREEQLSAQLQFEASRREEDSRIELERVLNYSVRSLKVLRGRDRHLVAMEELEAELLGFDLDFDGVGDVDKVKKKKKKKKKKKVKDDLLRLPATILIASSRSSSRSISIPPITNFKDDHGERERERGKTVNDKNKGSKYVKNQDDLDDFVLKFSSSSRSRL